MKSDFTGPVNVGSEEMVTINQLAEMTMKIAEKKLALKHVRGPLGVRGRNSDNHVIREKLGWAPSAKLEDGIRETFKWVQEQVRETGISR
jgi:nucleoside-diphosphate-sugar epimerase